MQLGNLGRLNVSTDVDRAPARLQGIPDGFAGMAATLRIMREYARAAIRDPYQRVREVALDAVSGLEPRAYGQEVRALQRWVRDEIRYVQDPVNVELVQTCERTLARAQGDCDDKATLLAAMLESIGHPCKFAAVGMDGEDFSHVLVRTKVGEAWVWCETILAGVEAGWCPPNITKAYFLKV